MKNPKQKSDFSLELTHTFTAPRERVFQAWTEPEQLMKWFPGPEMTHDGRFDVRPGGSYSMTVNCPDGPPSRIYGVFREVRFPEKLSYTWSFDPPRDTPVRDSLVTIEFRARGQWTDIVLRHEALPSEAERKEHLEGWKVCARSLEDYLSKKS